MKKYKLRLNLFAQNDIETAREYYNSKKIGLGDEFWMETKAKLEQIEKNPTQFQFIQDQTRKLH